MKKLIILIVLIEILLVAALMLSPDLVQAQLDCAADDVACLENPLAGVGINSVGDFITRFMQWTLGLFGIMAIAYVIYSGTRMIIATDEDSLKQAQSSLTWSVAGFVIALLSFTIISGVAGLLGFDPGAVANRDALINPITGFEDNPDLAAVLFTIMQNFLGILGAITVIMIIYFGFRYVAAAGNEDAIKRAKQGLTWSIVGLIVAVLAFTIIAGVQRLFL